MTGGGEGGGEAGAEAGPGTGPREKMRICHPWAFIPRKCAVFAGGHRGGQGVTCVTLRRAGVFSGFGVEEGRGFSQRARRKQGSQGGEGLRRSRSAVFGVRPVCAGR